MSTNSDESMITVPLGLRIMHDGWFWRSEVRYSEYNKDGINETLNGTPVGVLISTLSSRLPRPRLFTSSTGATEAKVELRAGGWSWPRLGPVFSYY